MVRVKKTMLMQVFLLFLGIVTILSITIVYIETSSSRFNYVHQFATFIYNKACRDKSGTVNVTPIAKADTFGHSLGIGAATAATSFLTPSLAATPSPPQSDRVSLSNTPSTHSSGNLYSLSQIPGSSKGVIRDEEERKKMKTPPYYVPTIMVKTTYPVPSSPLSKTTNTILSTKVSNTSSTNAILDTTSCQTEELDLLFMSVVNETDLEGLRLAMEAFDEAVRDNVTYFMYAGTLLGSYRHHGFIPWDKDIDLLVNLEHGDALEQLLEPLEDFKLTKYINEVWRFSHKGNGKTAEGFLWPYIDIFFYKEDEKNLWATFMYEEGVKYAKDDIFPLIERPFMGLMLPAPKNSSKILKQKFDIGLCRSNSYAPKDYPGGTGKIELDIPCDCLHDMFPYVDRIGLNSTNVYETLITPENKNNTSQITTYILPI